MQIKINTISLSSVVLTCQSSSTQSPSQCHSCPLTSALNLTLITLSLLKAPPAFSFIACWVGSLPTFASLLTFAGLLCFICNLCWKGTGFGSVCWWVSGGGWLAFCFWTLNLRGFDCGSWDSLVCCWVVPFLNFPFPLLPLPFPS